MGRRGELGGGRGERGGWRVRGGGGPRCPMALLALRARLGLGWACGGDGAAVAAAGVRAGSAYKLDALARAAVEEEGGLVGDAGDGHEYEVEVEKPLGLHFDVNESGEVVVDYVTPGGHAAATGRVRSGDVLRATSAVFGNDMWAAGELRRTLYALQMRRGAVTMRLWRPRRRRVNRAAVGGVAPEDADELSGGSGGVGDDDDDDDDDCDGVEEEIADEAVVDALADSVDTRRPPLTRGGVLLDVPPRPGWRMGQTVWVDVELMKAEAARRGKVLDEGAAGREGKAADPETEAYNVEMSRRMGTTIEYRHDLGVNYTLVADDVIVGSFPQRPRDLDHLADVAGVTAIINLQQPRDWEHFHTDVGPVFRRAEERGDVSIYRYPLVDFDPVSLRRGMFAAVARVHQLVARGHKVYIHCTAGLGRAPGVAIAYLAWCCGMDVQEAYDMVTTRRPCCPKIGAIREATHDALAQQQIFEGVHFRWNGGARKDVFLTGSFCGWSNPGIPMAKTASGAWECNANLLVGRHFYKFVVDGEWRLSEDDPTDWDGAHENNVVTLLGDPSDKEEVERRIRLVERGEITQEEHRLLVTALEAHAATHLRD